MKIGITMFKKKALLAPVILAISGAALAATSTPTETVKGRAPVYGDVGIVFQDNDTNGVASVGDTLTASANAFSDPDGDTATTPTYQWYSDDAPISGANNATYTLTKGDIGRVIRVGVIPNTDPSVTDPATGAEVFSSHGGAIDGSDSGDGTITIDSNAVASVTISGMSSPNPLVGDTLTAVATCTSGDDCTATSTIRWQIQNASGTGWDDIAGANASTYTIQKGDQKRKIQVVATK
ncbi:ZirU family protein [Edwardsiella tarda]|uniref:ZirU family protein n=2 Tax=Edwardsiella tarda TaxID=636 RepID=UPI00351BFCC7